MAGNPITIHQRIISTFPDGRVIEEEHALDTSDTLIEAGDGTFWGMFDDEYPLMRYTLSPGGRVLQEVVQETGLVVRSLHLPHSHRERSAHA